ncbi:MAG: TIR domain-containing protein [Desulfobulbaceae bacterium]|nr:TIR domain-containing protein [Desulfobulbaceae bacterium]
MADVFISYKSEDREQARTLAKSFEANGWSVWWDRKIVPGETFDQVIERELDEAGCVVVLWSQNSADSDWVKNEAAVAAERGVLVPAMIENVKLPLAFRRKQTATLTEWDGEATHPGFQALCTGVAAVLGRATPSLPPPRQPSKRRANRWKVFGASAAACAAIMAGLYWYLPGRDQRPTLERSIISSPQPSRQPGYREDVLRELSNAQREAVEMLENDKTAAIPLIDRNFERIDEAFRSFGGDPHFLTLKGYASKDIYQSSKGLLTVDRRDHYLALARESFEEALRLDPDNPGAHNGLGNVLFFEGNFDAAIEQHEEALRLTHGNYPAAEHDKQLVERVKTGKIPFDY